MPRGGARATGFPPCQPELHCRAVIHDLEPTDLNFVGDFWDKLHRQASRKEVLAHSPFLVAKSHVLTSRIVSAILLIIA